MGLARHAGRRGGLAVAALTLACGCGDDELRLVPGPSSPRLELVQTAGLSDYGSLALDAAGTPHAAYIEFTRHTLQFAVRGPEGWRNETLATSVTTRPTALLFTPANQPLVAYSAQGRLQFVLRDENGWSMDAPGDLGEARAVSLALDGAGRPHAAWIDLQRRAWLAARGDDRVWTAAPISAPGAPMMQVSLAFDASGRPCVCLVDSGRAELRFGCSDGGAWRFETMAWARPSDEVVLVSDGRGTLHCAWDRFNGSAGHGLWRDGRWWTDLLFDGHGVALGLDSQGRPAVVSTHSDELRTQRWIDGGWRLRIDRVASESFPGISAPQAAVDAGGRLHVLFKDQRLGDLAYVLLPAPME
jgi:hypothetical protein